MTARKRPTMADVAAAAGVSLSSVSLAYSGAGPVSPDMRARVVRAAAELGYAGPSPQARALRSGRTDVIGLILHERVQLALRDPFSLGVIDAIVGDLSDAGYGVLLLGTPADDATEPSLLDTVPMDAAILMGLRDEAEPALEVLRRRGLPFTTVEGIATGAAAVTIPDTDATAALIAHLRELGHERIGTITLPKGKHRETAVVDKSMLKESLWTSTRHRLEAFDVAGVEPCVIVETRGSMTEEGLAAGHLALTHPSRPTALVCQSDLLAAGAYLAAKELGLEVPRDVSITGFDGIDIAWLDPVTLTTVLQDPGAKGRLIAATVKGLLEGKAPEIVTFGLEVRMGDTTGPVPS